MRIESSQTTMAGNFMQSIHTIKQVCAGLMVAACFGFGAEQASADPSLDFNLDGLADPATASISYAATPGTLVGMDLGVDLVYGVDTPFHADPEFSSISDGRLSFESGGFLGSDATHWYFGGGGAITITGGIGSLGIAAGSTLLSGTLTGATVLQLGDSTEVALAAFFNGINPTLAAYFGLPASPFAGSFHVDFQTSASAGQFFSSTSTGSGDVITKLVPEPASASILGVLAAMSVVAERRRSTR